MGERREWGAKRAYRSHDRRRPRGGGYPLTREAKFAEVLLPNLGQTMERGTIVHWLKAEGEPVECGDVLFTVDTDKATLEVEAPRRGFLRSILVPEGETVPVLTVVGLITPVSDEHLVPSVPRSQAESGRDSMVKPPAVDAFISKSPRSDEQPGSPVGGRILASPRARKLALGERVDLTSVPGTGPGGRIEERDVIAHLETGPAIAPIPADLSSAAPARVSDGARKASPRSQQIATEQRVMESRQGAVPLTLATEVDATDFVELCDRMRSSLASELGFDIGCNDLLIKVAAHALEQFPYMNAQVEDSEAGAEGELVIHRQGEIHVALVLDGDEERHLRVIRNADRKSIATISREARDLAATAPAGGGLMDGAGSGIFRIIDLGMHELDVFIPAIHPPQVATLGIGQIRAKPVYRDGAVCVRQNMWLSLTFDQRAVGRAPAARFLQGIRQLIEEPYLLLG